MKTSDLVEFSTLLDSVCALMTRGQYMPNETSTQIFFRALEAHPIEAVRAAFAEHVRRSRFSPTPADLLDLLVASDGRPGAEEAWAMALSGRDESDTVVWTVETGEAFAVARTLLESGDDVGARMAFREVYNRLVDEARRRGSRAEWQVLLGHDPDRRVEAVKRAMAEGRAITGAMELVALPPPRGGEPIALPAPAAGDSEAAKNGKAALLALAGRMKREAAPELSTDAMAKLDTADKASDSAELAQAYAHQRGIDMTPTNPTGPAA